jgi:hypothetical protein
MNQSPYWEANSSSASPDIPNYLFLGRKFVIMFKTAHHLSLTSGTLTQCMSSHPIYLRSIFIFSSTLFPDIPSGLFPQGFSNKTVHSSHFSPTHPDSLILHVLITLIIFGKEYKSWGSSLDTQFFPVSIENQNTYKHCGKNAQVTYSYHCAFKMNDTT